MRTSKDYIEETCDLFYVNSQRMSTGGVHGRHYVHLFQSIFNDQQTVMK